MDGADKRINVRFFDENLKFIGELDSYLQVDQIRGIQAFCPQD